MRDDTKFHKKFGEMKIDFEELKEMKRKNFKERRWFIKYWANFIRTHPDKQWSRGQAILINSQIQGARDYVRKARERRKVRVDAEKVVKGSI